MTPNGIMPPGFKDRGGYRRLPGSDWFPPSRRLWSFGMAAKAPSHLSNASKGVWRRLVSDYGLASEPAALATLRLGLEALDRCEQARQVIDADGPTYTDRFGSPRARPEVMIERDARLAAVRCFRELSLDGDVGEARVPRPGGGRS